MSVIDELIEGNARFAESYPGPAHDAVPVRKVAIVACMDTRIVPMAALGLKPGEAHIIRNGGGRMADALRSLTMSQFYLGTEAVMLVQHTDCGLGKATNEEIRERVGRERGADVSEVDFLPFAEVEESVRADLALYAASPLVRQDIEVRGFVYDVETGRLREVGG